MSYRCWGEDGEDLSAKVEVAKAGLPPGKVEVFEAMMQRLRRSDDEGPRLILVKCSKGHENVFDV